jgi:hypothetical protein
MTSCSAPTPFETLVALWTGDLASDAADLVEAHLFTCDACAQTSDRLGQLVAGLRQVIPPVISHAHRDRLIARGLRLRQTPVQSGVDAEAHFTAEVDLLVHVLEGDLSRAERVDLEVLSPEGTSLIELPHVPFDRQTGQVLVACQRHYQGHEVVGSDPLFRVHAIEGGIRREVGSYFVRHYWR